MRKLTVITPGLLVGLGCTSMLFPPLDVVPSVDVQRYAGKWYEIASYPTPFQRGCTGTTAEYSLRDDGRVRVVNRCFQGSLEGPEQSIEGSARIVDAETNAKLKVSFFGPFEGDYWIIELDEDYQWAVVSEPSRSTLWILSRTPTLNDETYDMILGRLIDRGYDVTRLNRTPQPAEP